MLGDYRRESMDMRQHKSPPSRPPRTCVRSSVPSASLRRPEPEPDDHGRRLLELPFAVRQTGAHVVPGRSWRSPARHLGRSSCSPPPTLSRPRPTAMGAASWSSPRQKTLATSAWPHVDVGFAVLRVRPCRIRRLTEEGGRP
jgi:hypothetical protein